MLVAADKNPELQSGVTNQGIMGETVTDLIISIYSGRLCPRLSYL